MERMLIPVFDLHLNQIAVHMYLYTRTYKTKQLDSCQNKWLIILIKTSQTISAFRKPDDAKLCSLF